jgi:glycine oxidase
MTGLRMVDAAVWTDELTDAERAALRPAAPDRLERHPDVLVVGGGAVGLATAVACRAAGLGSVLVLERGERLAAAASGGNGGAVAPDMHTLTDSVEFVAFGRASLRRYRELEAAWDGAIGLRAVRWLSVTGAGGPPDRAPFPVLDAAAVRELEPDVVLPDGASALLVDGQAAVNPQRLAGALARRAGTVAVGTTVTGVRQRGERIVTVYTGRGDVHPGAVVMATGLVPPPWSGGVRQRWVKGHMLAVGPGPWRLGGVVAGEAGGGGPLPGGGLICGGTFDLDDSSPDVRPEVVAGLAEGLYALLPAARQAPVTHRWCCFRPSVEGRHPVIDRLPGTDNGWVSAGHFTTGVMMAAATGDALAAWVRDGAPPPEVAAFSLPAA